MSVVLNKFYDNKKGYFHIPVVWREEFQFQVGEKVGVDVKDGIIIIDKMHVRQFTPIIGVKGRLTIPIEIRQELKSHIYQLIAIQETEQFILTPA
jgi:bifunctional DNA-binding transcriptional regulator/antitoxin component of YhaV-PrlF toxin-antitoxin module